MALEVSFPEYYFMYQSSESCFGRVEEPVSGGMKDSPIPSTNNPIIVEGDNSSPTKTTSRLIKGEPIAEKNNPTTGDNPAVSDNYLTPSKATSIPDQNSPITSGSSSGLVEKGGLLAPSWVPIFWSHYIHDLESIWWILIWTLLTYQKHSDEDHAVDPNTELERRMRVRNLFYVDDYCIERSNHLENKRIFNGLARIIPDLFKGLIEVAAVFREKLVSTYIKEEGKSVFPIKLMDDGLLHRDILEAFRTSPIENFDVVYIFSKNKTATESTTDSDKTSESSKRSTCEDSDEERPFKRAR